MDDDDSLDQRLAAVGADSRLDPVTAWRLLRGAEGSRITVIDLYELAARPRGLQGHELPLHERLALARSVLPTVWPDFESTADSERAAEPVELVDYDPEWPQQYERWRARIVDCLGPTALRIEHVGSTAVPGLPAKPIIDVQVSVADLAAESAYVEPLENAGLQLRSRDGYHRYFRPFPHLPREVHVHVCAVDSPWEREHLLFRDYLRNHAGARRAYAMAKRRAADLWADDRIAYTDAKTATILRILDDAAQWRTVQRSDR